VNLSFISPSLVYHICRRFESFMENLLVIEPNMGGHYGVYLRWIVRGALGRNLRVFIATFENSLDHPIFKTMLDECEETPEIITLPSPATDWLQKFGLCGLARREIFYRRLFERFYDKAVQKRMPDLVFLPFLDYCAYAIGLLGSPFGRTPWAGIVMRPAFHYKEVGIIGPRSLLLLPKQLLFLRMLQQKKLEAMFTIDPSLYEYLSIRAPSCPEKVYYLRDPGEFEGDISKETARQLMHIPKEAVVILVYGTIDYRKSVDILLSAAADPHFPADVHILLAGRHVSVVTRLLSSPLAKSLKSSGRLHQMNKFLNDDEEYMVFKASDIAWLGYRGHYTMSGMLGKAGLMGLPVIACKEGLIGWFTKKYKLGVALNNLDKKGVIDAINRLLLDKEKLFKFGNAARKCFAEHTTNNFVADIFQLIP